MTTKKPRRRTQACAEEKERLARRTAELEAETSALELSKRPFSLEEHEVLREHLRQHRLDLADYRRRCLNQRGVDAATCGLFGGLLAGQQGEVYPDSLADFRLVSG